MSAPADDRVLFAEQMWVPWQATASIIALPTVIAAAIVVIAHPDATSTIIGMTAMPSIGIAVAALFVLGARRVVNRVGEQTLRLGRARPVPVQAIREVRLVEGSREITRLRRRLRGDAAFFGSSFNPALKGILAPPRCESAVLIRVDPQAGPTHTFLVGTRRPNELLAALGRARPGGEPDRVVAEAAV